jgi:DNA-binding transcriptional LysR family regulator
MELTDLRVFLAVAETGSFSRAAGELVRTQPAVSERVAGLERSVGTALFERTSRGARLTARGEQLLPYARRCIAIADDALEAVRAEATVPRLRIAVHTTFAQRAVPFVLDAIGDLPRRISVRDAHSNEVQEMVLDDGADVGFVLPDAVARGLHREDLPDDEIVCVAAPGHPLTRRRRLALPDLAGALVAVNLWGDDAMVLLALLEEAGLPPTSLRLITDSGIAGVLARDLGHVAVVTMSTVARDVDQGALCRLRISGLARWRVPLALVVRRNGVDEPAAARLITAAQGIRRRLKSGVRAG